MNNKYKYLIIVFLIVSSFVAFSPVTGNDFVNLDDYEYITANHHIKSGISPESIKWAFTAVVASNWHPLTLLSHALDWSMFGADPSGHHLVSLLWHIGSVLLLFFSLLRTTENLWPSAFAAALFALHPLRVESVAWASERKDVLAMFFGMASIYAYALYCERDKRSLYVFSLVLFALSLTAKPLMVTLPFILLLLDYWPLKRLTRISSPANVPETTDETGKKKKGKTIKPVEKHAPVPSARQSVLLEKVPFLFLTIISCIVTLRVQNISGAVISMDKIPFLSRIANAVVSYVSYLGKFFYPVDLAVFYPYVQIFDPWRILASFAFLAAVTAAVLYAAKKMPFLFVGWFWYLGTLIPMIGLVQAGTQAMADRYTYLPSVGIAVALAWGIPFLFGQKNPGKKLLFTAGIPVLAVLAFLTWNQCGYWKNSIELLNHALRITKNNDLAHNNIGSAFLAEGRIGEAIGHYNKAIAIKNSADHYNNRGVANERSGRYQLALEDYSQAVRLKPDYAEAYFNRGNLCGTMGLYEQAIENYNTAIRLKPDHVGAFNNRGIAYLKQGNRELGCPDAQKVCAWGDCRLLEEAKSKGDCP